MKISHMSAVALAMACLQFAQAAPANDINIADVESKVITGSKTIHDILQNNPVINQTQANIFNTAIQNNKPLISEQDFVKLLKARGGTYQDLVKIIYELQGQAYPNIQRTPDVPLKASLSEFRKLGMTLFANRSLVEMTEFERTHMPLFSILDGPVVISQEVILPTLFKLVDLGGAQVPDWFPNLPADQDLPPLVPGGWVDNPSQKPLNPAVDVFYNPPAALYNGKSHGEPIAFRRFMPSDAYINIDRGFQYSFASQDALGLQIPATSGAMIPKNFDNKNVFHFLQYTDSRGPSCIPSHQIATSVFDPSPDYFLRTGRIVNMPDHGGPQRFFGIGQTEGRITLDAMLALDNLKEAFGIKYDDHYLYGYSGGTVPTGWAMQLHDEYAPSVNIKAGAVGGVIANLIAVGRSIDGTPFSGFNPPVLKSYMVQYPEYSKALIADLKSEKYLDRFNACDGYCIGASLLNNFAINMTGSMFKSGDKFWELPGIGDTYAKNQMGKQPVTKVPFLVYNGIQDEVAPITAVDAVVDYWCKEGALIDYYRLSGLGHIGAYVLPFADLVDFFEKVINHDYKPATCSSWKDATRTSKPQKKLSDLSFDDARKAIYGDFVEIPAK